VAIRLRRKIYPRGGSFETTLPLPLLFQLDLEKKHDAVFEFDDQTKRWYLSILPRDSIVENSYSDSQDLKLPDNSTSRSADRKRNLLLKGGGA
jgi:hypothetical protein